MASDGTGQPRHRLRYLLGGLGIVLVFGGAGFGIAAAVVSGPSSTTDAVQPAPGNAVARAALSGMVTAVDAANHRFTVSAPASSGATVEVNASTTYRTASGASGSFSDVKVGVRVAVTGSYANGDTGTVLAAHVQLGGSPGHRFGGFGGPGRAAIGSVKSVDTGSGRFTVASRDGTTVTVATSSSTTYLEPGVASAGFSALKAGELVVVSGSTDSAKVVHATQVFILPSGFGGGPGRGGFGPGAGAGAGAGVG